jgi:hypothetical protein
MKRIAAWGLFLLAGLTEGAGAEECRVAVDLSGPDALAQWHVLDKRPRVKDGVLRLDGGGSPCRVFLKTPAFGDVSLSASYRVEEDSGVMAVGFVIGSTDSVTFTYVHYDKNSAILCRSDAEQSWREVKRTGKPHQPDTWYAARLEREGNRVRVFFEDRLLYEAECAGEPGLVGFYASQTLGQVKDIVVTGTPAGLAEPWTQVPPQWVHVCTDGGAGGYEAFPDVCRTADGRLLAVFYAGYGHVSLPSEALPKGGRISGCFSSDEGRTWSDAFTVFDGPYDDRDPSVTQLKDGRLTCSFFTLKPKPGGGQGYDGLGSFWVASADGGKTWETEPRQLAAGYYCSSPIRELADGRLALGLYKQDGTGACGAVTFSGDGGATWGAPVDIPTGGLSYEAETDLIERKDGSLFAALRGQAHSGWSVSRDGGQTWSVAELFGFPGHCHYLHRAPGDIILMAHRLPNTSLHYSLDECETWSTNVVVDTVGGAYPSMVTLKDGSIRIVYYEEGSGSNIRSRRFRVTRDGIEWLAADGPQPQLHPFSDGTSVRITCTVYPLAQTARAKSAGMVIQCAERSGTL